MRIPAELLSAVPGKPDIAARTGKALAGETDSTRALERYGAAPFYSFRDSPSAWPK
jgi:hypothetical protein